MTCARKTSWNKTLIPGPSNSSNMETAATLERRRETLIKKAKEYHKELESLLVSHHFQFNFLPRFFNYILLFYILSPPFSSLKTEEPLQVPITISQLLEQKEKNQIRERELKEKRAKIKAFQGLPPVSKSIYGEKKAIL